MKREGRVLVLACEWTRCVEATAQEYHRRGWDVHVIASGCDGESSVEIQRGLQLHGVEVPEGDLASVAGSAILNIRLAAMGSRVLATYGSFELLVAHDEQVADGTALLAEKARLPICMPTRVPQQRPLSPMEVNR
ncbi:hypothetical protein [Tumebacillus permanentifrigoris]|uniref:Uncharacterized protein n=1 Tax=Tumebacillus permanentifrigoris TaxID=378543 RepID=A0A316DAP5_9BACL|nr:hypothetical protein [Tumebacillus permanentifrigoris]PWK13902.1 hypothetical protein C7459_106182 [Tumebacillus permanentifrigoris]